MNRLLFVVLWFFMTGVRADEAAVLDKDCRTMMQWFPGVYDNQEQVYYSRRKCYKYAYVNK